MATTRADLDNKKQQPAFVWGLSVVNSIKNSTRKHKEKMPVLKLGGVILLLALSMLLYVIYVNKASTHGYFYKVETRKLDAIKAEYNLVKLDVLEYQKKLRNQSDDFSAWSDPMALRHRLIVIDPSKKKQTPNLSGAVSHSKE